jgi:spore germination cell wall hydrolase CwlJ-like protein
MLNELFCAAAIMWGEAGGESDLGKTAALYSAINRKADPYYPKNICQIMSQPYQYEFLQKRGMPSPRDVAHLMPLAKAIIEGRVDDPTQGKKHFYRYDIPTPKWAIGKKKQKIGNHIFVA